MKIVIVVYRFPPKWIGGTELATYNIARYLSKLGHEIHVVTTFDQEDISELDNSETFVIHRLHFVDIEIIKAILFQVLVFQKIWAIKPDVIHVQNIALGLPGLLAKLSLKTPYLIYGRGSDVYASWPFKNIISKIVIKEADAVLALSENMKRRIQEIESRNVIVIPNGIDLDRFRFETKESIRRKLNFNEDDRIIISVGNLRSIKGFKYLIEAMAKIAGEERNVKLIILGDGEERSNLEDLVNRLSLNKCIEFLGRVSNESIPKYMMASDLFVLPSLSESFGIVNLEAMASGLPIVATNVGGLPELIKEGNGFLVEPQNSIELSRKMLKILNDEKLTEKISCNNKNYVKNFGWDRIALKLENVYLGIIRNYKTDN